MPNYAYAFRYVGIRCIFAFFLTTVAEVISGFFLDPDDDTMSPAKVGLGQLAMGWATALQMGIPEPIAT